MPIHTRLERMPLRGTATHIGTVSLLFIAGLSYLPMSAAALPPFDIANPAARTVVIWIDNEVTDPSNVGNDLEFAFNGSWTSNGTTGTIVVD